MVEWKMYDGKVMPCNGLKMPKTDNERQRFLFKTEAQHLMGVFKKRSPNKWWLIALLSLKAGLRLGEILSLRGSEWANWYSYCETC